MTARERKIVAVVGVFILGWLGYYFYTNMMAETDIDNNPNTKFNEAQRLIRAQVNIVNLNQRASERLNELQKKFFGAENSETAQSDFLKEVERIASQTQLNIQQKNIMKFSDNSIGVAIEGKTSPDSVVRFIQLTTEAKYNMKIQRLQMHVSTDTKQVSYQITLNSILVPKNEQ